MIAFQLKQQLVGAAETAMKCEASGSVSTSDAKSPPESIDDNSRSPTTGGNLNVSPKSGCGSGNESKSSDGNEGDNKDSNTIKELKAQLKLVFAAFL